MKRLLSLSLLLAFAVLPDLQSHDSYSLDECTLLVFAIDILCLLLLLCCSAALPAVARLLQRGRVHVF